MPPSGRRPWAVLLLGTLVAVGCGPRTSKSLVPRQRAAKVSTMPDPNALTDIDALWDFQDPAGSRSAMERRRVELEARLAAGTLPRETMRQLELARLELLTQLARTHSLEKRVDEADVLLARVRDELGSEPSPDTTRVRVRLLLEDGRVRRTAKEADAARVLFEEAWTLARTDVPALDGLAVDAAHMVAIACSGTPGEQEWGEKALALAESSPNPDARKWRASLLNNLGWGAFDREEFDVALALMQRQIVLRKEAGKEPALRIALWSEARVLRALGRVEEALAAQEALVETYGEAATTDGFVHEELAECLQALGREDDAPAWFASAHALLSDTWLAEAEPDRLARLAELGGVDTP